MVNTKMQDLKIKPENHSQFLKAWEALIQLGYHSSLIPNTAHYLYCYSNGNISFEFDDGKGDNPSNPDTNFAYFKKHANKEITLEDLLNMATKSDQTSLVQKERPLFEANYIKRGGQLNYLKCDENGLYQADWDAINEANINDSEFDADIQELGSYVTGCFSSWMECAKEKGIPEGYCLMPIQPSEEMLAQAECEFDDLSIDDIQDRIVFSHQAMVGVAAKKK